MKRGSLVLKQYFHCGSQLYQYLFVPKGESLLSSGIYSIYRFHVMLMEPSHATAKPTLTSPTPPQLFSSLYILFFHWGLWGKKNNEIEPNKTLRHTLL